MPDTLEIVTFGCRLNSFESEVMRARAREAGLTDAVIVNTCAVTGEAERQARQMIRRLRRERPNARIVVAGCGAQITPDAYAKMPEVDRVLGNREKLETESYRAQTERVSVGSLEALAETAPHLIEGFEDRARAFVEVQQGCDHRCTFCIVPMGRGPNRAVPVTQIVTQARALTAAGYKELVLTGVDLASYGGHDSGHPKLSAMIRRLLAETPDLKRLRLSSLDPAMCDEDLLELVATESRLMPHVHLSVQAGNDLVLKRMKRRHLRADIARLADSFRKARQGIALGADLIAGFPGETDADFQDTLALIDEAELTHLHVFPYSSRPGTPAARMPRQVFQETRKTRAALLRAAGERAKRRFMESRIGQTAQVLIEKDGFGHCEHYLPVAVGAGQPGDILSVRLHSIVDEKLSGQLL